VSIDLPVLQFSVMIFFYLLYSLLLLLFILVVVVVEINITLALWVEFLLKMFLNIYVIIYKNFNKCCNLLSVN